ncbi:hypothetical protein K443DRAFT_624139, partial [Laccaria amethystina LaAM-08-1]
MIFESNPGFVFHDSRGFEAGRSSELDDVKNFIKSYSSKLRRSSKRLHVIWYCIPINNQGRPITRAELNFFDECGTGKIPVLVLFTKADMLDAETIECLVNSGMSLEEAAIKAPEESAIKFQNSFGNQLYKKKYPPTGHLYLRDMQTTSSHCNALMEHTAALLSADIIKQLFFSVQQHHLSLSVQHAIMR